MTQGKAKADANNDSEQSDDSMMMDIDAGVGSDFEEPDSDVPPPKKKAPAKSKKAPAKAPAKKAPVKGRGKKAAVVRISSFPQIPSRANGLVVGRVTPTTIS